MSLQAVFHKRCSSLQSTTAPSSENLHVWFVKKQTPNKLCSHHRKLRWDLIKLVKCLVVYIIHMHRFLRPISITTLFAVSVDMATGLHELSMSEFDPQNIYIHIIMQMHFPRTAYRTFSHTSQCTFIFTICKYHFYLLTLTLVFLYLWWNVSRMWSGSGKLQSNTRHDTEEFTPDGTPVHRRTLFTHSYT